MKSFRQFVKEEKEEDFEVTHTGWHGSPDARDIHKNGFKTLAQRYGKEDSKAIFWASKEHHIARSYADDKRAFNYQEAEPATLPVELHMKNPKHIEWQGRKFRGNKGEGFNIHHEIDQARKDGHDGFVINNVIDDYHAKSKPGTIMGVFSNKRIRIKKS